MGGRIRLVGGKDVQDSNRDKTGLEPGLVPPEGHLPPPKAKVEPQRRGKHLLNDKAIAAWIRGGMKGTLRDGQSLYLEGGARGPVWRIDYRHGGKENTYTVGWHGTGEGEFSIAKARAERDRVRGWRDRGLDANIEKKAEKARTTARQGQTFELLGREFLEVKAAEWSTDHAEARRRLFENDLLPPLGVLPVADLEPATALAALKRIEQRGAHEVASKARVLGSLIARYGIVTGRMTSDPFQHLGDALKRPPVVNRATVEAEQMPELFQALAQVPAEPVVKLALHFQIATAVRPGEVRFAPWSEIKDDKRLWVIPAERMKMRVGHTQPLSPLALRILERARELRQTNKPDELIFPGFTRHGALSENAFTSLLARSGHYGRQSAHGFRAAFRTWAGAWEPPKGEREFDPIAVELCLAHRQGGIKGVYDRSEYIPARRRILTFWGEQLIQWGLELPE